MNIETKDNKFRVNFTEALIMWEGPTYELESYFNYKKKSWPKRHLKIVSAVENNINEKLYEMKLYIENDNW